MASPFGQVEDIVIKFFPLEENESDPFLGRAFYGVIRLKTGFDTIYRMSNTGQLEEYSVNCPRLREFISERMPRDIFKDLITSAKKGLRKLYETSELIITTRGMLPERIAKESRKDSLVV